MELTDISVDLRLSSRHDSKARAFAEVTLPIASDGFLKLSGFVVFQSPGTAPHVGLPTQKGRERYFETVFLIGRIRHLVEQAILDKYVQAVPQQPTPEPRTT